MRELVYVCGNVVVKTIEEAKQLPSYTVEVREITSKLSKSEQNLAEKRYAKFRKH